MTKLGGPCVCQWQRGESQQEGEAHDDGRQCQVSVEARMVGAEVNHSDVSRCDDVAFGATLL